MTFHLVVDRPVARSLPSRHRFALSRLAAFVRLGRRSQPQEAAEHLILAIDRDQTGAEMNCVALWVLATAASYFAVALPFPWPLSILAGVALAILAIHIPIVGGGFLLRLLIGDGDHASLVSAATMTLLFIASGYFAMTSSWVRFVGWLFIGMLVINGIAALFLWLLRDKVRSAEERCVR